MRSDTTVLALSTEHMVKLTGLTARQLAYWDQTGFFKPEHATDDRRTPYARVYSFQDAVGLRTISRLLHVHGVSLPHLKKVAEKLSSFSDRVWSDLKLRVWDRRVHFEDAAGSVSDAISGQYVLLPIIDVIHEVEDGVKALQTRAPNDIGRFERHRHVLHNRLVLAGTRIPVATILEFVAEGYSPASIVDEFPGLTVADVEAVTSGGKAALAAA